MPVQGRRVYDLEPHEYEPGDYGLWDGAWYCRAPVDSEHRRLQGNLRNHQVAENEDGTITVSPSILVSALGAPEPNTWHGFLERGVWRSV